MAVDTPKVVGAIAFYFTVSISLVFLNKARAAAGQSQAPTPRDDTGSRAHRSSSPVAPASMRRFSSRGTNAWCVGPAAPLRWRAARGRDAARHPTPPVPPGLGRVLFRVGRTGPRIQAAVLFPALFLRPGGCASRDAGLRHFCGHDDLQQVRGGPPHTHGPSARLPDPGIPPSCSLCLQYVEVHFYQVARSLSIFFNIAFSTLILGQHVSWRVRAHSEGGSGPRLAAAHSHPSVHSGMRRRGVRVCAGIRWRSSFQPVGDAVRRNVKV